MGLAAGRRRPPQPTPHRPESSRVDAVRAATARRTPTRVAAAGRLSLRTLLGPVHHAAPIGAAPQTTPTPPRPRRPPRERTVSRLQKPQPTRRAEPAVRADPPPRSTSRVAISTNPWLNPGWVVLADLPFHQVLHQPHPGVRRRAMYGRRIPPSAQIWRMRPPSVPPCRECGTIRAAALAGQQTTPRAVVPGQRLPGGAAPERLQVVRGGLPGLGRRR